ncbi:50S ribosomal protein L22 [Candidatus Parcubacteria bacterium]|nr:MAG: 50S ribosomal protein L22 [Candidatus Parcubacteria bacterium]
MAEQRAIARYVRIAPRKVRAVAGLIRGLSVNEAEAQLLAQRRRAAVPLLKLLRSAVASVKERGHMQEANLYIAKIAVDEGPMMKRYMPRARGAVNLIQKKTSHVTLVLGEREGAAPARFVIARPKKEKKIPRKADRQGRERERELAAKSEKAAEQRKRKGGFLKRVFRRKSVAEG